LGGEAFNWNCRLNALTRLRQTQYWQFSLFHFLPSIISNIGTSPKSLLIKVWRFKDGRKFYDTMPFSLRHKHSILHELTRYRRWQIFYLLLEINFIRFAAFDVSGFPGTAHISLGNACLCSRYARLVVYVLTALNEVEYDFDSHECTLPWIRKHTWEMEIVNELDTGKPFRCLHGFIL
jgi:hypothetical protein